MLTNIKDKIYKNQRLTGEEGIEPYRNFDLLTLGRLAGYKNPGKHV